MTPGGPIQTAAPPPALDVVDAQKTYPATRRTPALAALAGVSLRIAPGEWVGLLGPNGSGKSTLVRAITGAGSLDAGRIAVFGHGPEAPRAAAARTSVVFQAPGLDALLTVRENLRSQAALFGLPRAQAAARIDAVAAELGVADRLDHRVATLSGGLARRVDLARALLHGPDLLILDEATAGLDLQARSAFFDAIARLRAARPVTILMTTHLMEEADLADRVVMMAAGRIVADGTPADLRARCGGDVLRARPAPADLDETAALLRGAGLDVATTLQGVVIGRTPAAPHDGAAADLRRAVNGLLDRGVPFELSPPTLGDAYLMLTGEALDAPAQRSNGAPPRRTRMRP